MVNDNKELNKFYINEPIIKEICGFDDKNTGKLIRLIYNYVLYDKAPKEEFNDRAELKFWVLTAQLDDIKNLKRAKPNTNNIVFERWLAKIFNFVDDTKAGLLFKKMADETLGTDYLKGKNVEEINDLYADICVLRTREKNEAIRKKRNAKHDFSKIKAEFSNLNWYGFDERKYQNVDCVKLYKFMVDNHLEEDSLHISEVIDAYFNNM